MVWGGLGKVSHIGFFPLTVSWATMPRGIKAVVCNSLVEAKKTAGAKDMFNEKVATSDIALMLFRRRYPHLATKLKRMRDLNPSNLGVSLSQFYGMLKSLPLSATREELRKVLSAHARDIERLFREHAEPSAGYAVRGVALFVASECERSRIAPEAVARGPERLGLLMKVSHNGDREVVHLNGKGKRWTVPIDNRYLDELSRMSSHRVPEGVRLHMQSGSYGCGHERTDMLVDIALSVPGVLGAQLVGAGLGGSVVVLVREQSVEALLSSLAAGFYGSREEAIRNTVMCTPIGGASVLRFGSPS
jgi:galactokinase